jgi:myosin heavy subunit
MQQEQMAMKGENSDAVKRAMRRAIDDANYLSKNQEELLKEAAQMDPNTLLMRDMAEKQQDLSAASNGLKNTIQELGKQSPFIAAELQALLQKATQNMEMATQLFDEKQGMRGMNDQRNAMVGLNKASLRLMESLEEQSKCDKGGNCDKNMGKLEQLSKKQSQLNQQTQQCNNPSQMQPGQGRQTLERLAGEQGSIRKSMEELEKEFGNSRQVLGRLDDIAKEMREIEEDMADGEIGESTVERQLRVYSRMLEASRSLQRRDFTEQRKANTATNNPIYIPPALSADMLNDRAAFEDRLRQFLGDNYPPQYEEQIKAYFRALLQVESQPKQPQTVPTPGQ